MLRRESNARSLDFSESQCRQRFSVQATGDPQTVTSLKARNRSTCLRTNDAVDRSVVKTVLSQMILRRRNGRGRIFVRRGSVLTVILVVLVAVRIFRIIRVRIVVVVRIIIAVRKSVVPRIKAGIEHDPVAVEEMTTMPVPPMIMITIPIALPVRRTLRDDMIAPFCGQIITASTNLARAA